MAAYKLRAAKTKSLSSTGSEKEKHRITSRKKIVIADLATEKKVLSTRPEPEFKDRVVIQDDGHAVLESEQVFMCDKPGCNSLFTNADLLRRHIAKHLDVRIKCEICKIIFKSTNDKSEHLEEFHPDLEAEPEADPLQCKKCRKVCATAFQLSRHIRRSHQKRKYPCPHCGFEYTQLEGLQGHLKRKHLEEGAPAPTYPCEICKRVFDYSVHWRKHILKFHRIEDKEYKCVLCKTVYFCKRVYRNHLLHHTQPRSFSCHVCNINFRHQARLRMHLETLTHKKNLRARRRERNQEEIKFSLKNVFPETKTLEELKQMTTKELLQFCSQRIPKIILHRVDNQIMVSSCAKPQSRKNRDQSGKILYLKCVYCHQAFPSLTEVNQHETLCKTEKNNKMYKCGVCNQSFKRRHLLTSHSIIHSTERPYKCHYCESFFKRKDIRLRHEKSFHFGLKIEKKVIGQTFTCPYEGCGKEYCKNKNLTRHVKSSHIGINFPCKDCGKIFSRRDYRTIHEQREHAKQPDLILECKPCNKTFAHKTIYLAHSKGVRHKKKLKEFERRNKKQVMNKKVKDFRASILQANTGRSEKRKNLLVAPFEDLI